MDIETINWAYFAAGVFAFLFLIWFFRARHANAGFIAGVVSFAHLVIAGVNSAAPVQGYLDPAYSGYSFGLLHADPGLPVAMIAGGLWVVCVLSAFLALSHSKGAMVFVALSSVALAVILGVPLLQGVMTNPEGNHLQVGEYLSLPGPTATVLIAIAFVAPFLIGFLWGGGRAMTRR